MYSEEHGNFVFILRPHRKCEAGPLVPCGESARIVCAWHSAVVIAEGQGVSRAIVFFLRCALCMRFEVVGVRVRT